MKRLVFISLIFVIIIGLSCNAFAFTFVEEGFPKEPNHNKKWIMFEIMEKKYYFETAKEIDLDSSEIDDYLWLDSDVLNNGQPIDYYEYDGAIWKCGSFSAMGFEVGKNYKILYSNYNVLGKFSMVQPYLRYFLRCVNVSDILAFCIVIFSVVISTTFIKRSGCSL